jgi:hypothetical protein
VYVTSEFIFEIYGNYCSPVNAFVRSSVILLLPLFIIFYIISKHVLDELKRICNIIFEKNIVLVEENLIHGVYEGKITEDLLLVNLVICILKWVIWKTRNYIENNKVNNLKTVKTVMILTWYRHF